MQLSNDILELVAAQIRAAKSGYGRERKIEPLWAVAQEGISRTFDQIGRMPGGANAWRGGDVEDALVKAKVKSPEWGDIILQANSIVQRIDNYGDLEREIPNIEDLVEHSFNIMGLFPVQNQNGLRIFVR